MRGCCDSGVTNELSRDRVRTAGGWEAAVTVASQASCHVIGSEQLAGERLL